MKLHFLASADFSPLTKQFSMVDGRLVSVPYPMVTQFNSFEIEVQTIEEFFTALTTHAEYNHCLLKGQIDRQLQAESRAGHTTSDSTSEWMVLDNDGLDLEPQQLMTMLGLGDVDYILQHSASGGVVPGKCGYHIFFLLDRPCTPDALKLQLRSWNLNHPQIARCLQLNRTGNALRWPLDITVCQNDKLLYIAPPILGPGVVSNLEGERIRLVKASQRRATLGVTTQSDSTLRAQETTVINHLRASAGLPQKDFVTHTMHGVGVARNPDQAQVTGQKEGHDFVYLNLNGGDSWGYYHPVTSPDVLYNFKGEQNYLIQELLPDYYPEAKRKAEEARHAQELESAQADIDAQSQRLQAAEKDGGHTLLAFRDKQTDKYYVGKIWPAKKKHCFNEIGTKARIKELYQQHGLPAPEIVPSVDFHFEPANDALYDMESGFINRYIPSLFLRAAQQRSDAALPPTIGRLINHVLGADEEVAEHFLNWIAVLFRYRIRTQTAWILQGTTGTGKGLLFSAVLRPLIGEDYCRIVNLNNLEEQFNGFADRSMLLFIDEVDTDQVKQMPKLLARFKTWITEPRLAMRAMRQDLTEIPNHLNLILSSNQPNSMRIEANDRRFNVCPRQETPLFAPSESGEEFVEKIESELPAFADYLMSRNADRGTARKTLENRPKQLLQQVTQTAIEEVAEAFRMGDLAYFLAARPLHEGGSVSLQDAAFDGKHYINLTQEFGAFLVDAISKAGSGSRHVVTHLYLFVVFELLVGGMPRTKTKLTKRLGHQHLTIEPCTAGSTSVRGLAVTWHVEPGQTAEWQALLDAEQPQPTQSKCASVMLPR
ncbi:MAG: DUF5906 domain-containing protein [Chromatiaceae bacterium]|nr:DUF5906 domain-containing protein [Chromatiaceae bacterium]MCF8015262.1 DUF5906 domain-containing protein [Chromatiaceae bacterium]